MAISETLKKLLKPGEKALVFDPESGDILHSDVAPLMGSKAAHLGDVIDLKNDKELMQIVSMAMRLPGTMAESDCAFRSEKCRLRVVYYASPEPRIFLFIGAN